MITLYGYKKCGTCRKAEQQLKKWNKQYKFVDITEHPPTPDTLRKIVKASCIDIKKLFNTSGVQYRELNIKTKLPTLSENDIYDLLASNGRLIKRPIVTNGLNATVGFNEELFSKTWS